MKMLCQNPNCDFEYEDQPTAAAMQFYPRCGGSHFANVKPVLFGAEFGVIQRFTTVVQTAVNSFSPGCAPPPMFGIFTAKV